jgi:hypothetical protein
VVRRNHRHSFKSGRLSRSGWCIFHFLVTRPNHSVQAYFTWRAWVVSGKVWYATPPWVVEFIRLVIVFVNCGYLARDKTLGDFRSDHGYLVTTTLVTCLFVSCGMALSLQSDHHLQVDIWNSAVLIYHLSSQRIVLRRWGVTFERLDSNSFALFARFIRQLVSIILWSVGTLPSRASVRSQPFDE